MTEISIPIQTKTTKVITVPFYYVCWLGNYVAILSETEMYRVGDNLAVKTSPSAFFGDFQYSTREITKEEFEAHYRAVIESFSQVTFKTT